MDVILHLPVDLVERAQAIGLLSELRMRRLLEAEINRQEQLHLLEHDIVALHAAADPLSSEEMADLISEAIAFVRTG